MNIKIASMVALVMLAGCEQKAVPLEKVMPPPPIKTVKPKNLLLSDQSIGPISFGAPLSQVECGYVSFEALPKVRFMVEKGVIVRADVDAQIANANGIRVGDTEAELKGKFANLKVEPHEFVAGGHVFTLPGQGKSAMVMESDGAKVTSIRAGLQPAVSYSEGCS